jgi:hypothetical protein
MPAAQLSRAATVVHQAASSAVCCNRGLSPFAYLRGMFCSKLNDRHHTMKLVEDYPRRLVGLLWAFSACLFLWFFSHAQPEPFSLESFFHFSFMLLGGGASYHILVELFTTPYINANAYRWKKLLISMSSLMCVLLITGGLILTDKYIWPRNGVLAFISLFLGYGGLWFVSQSVGRAFIAIRSNPPVKQPDTGR